MLPNETPQDRIQKGIYRIQRKMFDTYVQTLGIKSKGFVIETIEDKFHNIATTIKDYRPISYIINFPGNEIPSTSSDDTNQSSTTLYLYDILPITGYFKFEDKVKKNDIILYKVKKDDTNFEIIPFQLVDIINTATKVAIVYVAYNLAPITNHALLQNPAYLSIVERFENEDNW